MKNQICLLENKIKNKNLSLKEYDKQLNEK